MSKLNERAAARIPGWLLALLFLALVLGALALFRSYTRLGQEGLYLTPMRTDDKGWDIYRLEDGGGRVPLTTEELMESTRQVCLSRVLDPAYEAAGYTTLELDGPVSVFLDGALLYTTSPGSGSRPEEVRLPDTYEVLAAGESPRLTLPTGYSGKELTLVFGRGSDSYGTPMVRLTSRAVDTAGPVVTANTVMIPAAAYMTAALFLLALLLYGGYQGRWALPLLLLALAAALQSLYQLRAYGFRLLGSSWLDFPAAELIPTLFVLLPLGYLLCRTQGRHRRLRAVLALAPGALALLLGVASLLFPSLPTGGHALKFALLALSIALVLACAGVEAAAGNRVFRLFWAGLGSMAAALTAACLISPTLAGNVTAALTLALQGVLDTPVYWCGAALFVLCAALGVDDAIRRTAEVWAKADMLSTQVFALRSRVEATRAAEEAMRIERHDMRHQLQVVAGMVEKGEIAPALDFIGASQERLDAVKPVRWCQNPVLDAVFSSYLEQARRQGIQVEASLAIPEALPVDALELSAVFANALENAIHACACLPEGQRKIVCRCLNRPQLMFEVANPYSGQVSFDAGGLPVSTRRGHGIGTRSIAAFCEKHGALCSYEAKDGWFRLRVVL